MSGDEYWTIAVAHARAAGQQRVLVTDVGVGVEADGGDIEFAARGTFVERLDILQNVLEAEAVRGNQILRQRIKHESVIGIGRVAKRQRCLLHG